MKKYIFLLFSISCFAQFNPARFYQYGSVKDFVGNIYVGYSLRKINTSYSGSCIRVRRSSDNTESDIGFLGNDLDISTLLSFVGSGTGYVTTWYDQSGNGINAITTTTTMQPVIVNSGSLITQNSKSSIYFNGTTNRLNGGTTFSLNTQDYSIFAVFKSEDNNSNGRAVYSLTPTGSSAHNGWNSMQYRNNITNNLRWLISSNGNESNVYTVPPISNYASTFILATSVIKNSNKCSFYLNNVLQSYRSPIGHNVVNAELWIGAYYNGGTTYLHSGYISEIVLRSQGNVYRISDANNDIISYYSL